MKQDRHTLKIIFPLFLFISSALADDFRNFDVFFQSNNGDLTALNSFLSSGVDPNATDKTGYTLLQKSILNRNTEAARSILDHGAEVNIDFPEIKANGDPSKATPPLIKITIKTPRIPLELVSLLLQNGLDISVTDQTGNTALIRVVYLLHQWPNRHYRREFMKLLIRYKININAQNQNGDTALHIASKMGDLDTARTLISSNARLDLVNRQGMTPIQLAKFMSSPIPIHNTGLKWYWYFSFFDNRYKIIRLLQEAETQNGFAVPNHSKRFCKKSFQHTQG